MSGSELNQQNRMATRNSDAHAPMLPEHGAAHACDASAKLLEDCSKSVAQSATWLGENVASPFVNKLVYEPYNAAANYVNGLGRLVGVKHLLAKHKLDTVPEATPYSAEFVAQELSSGLASTLPYAIAGRFSGVGLRAIGGSLRVRGLAYKVMSSEKTAQIMGAAFYDGLKDTRDGETWQGNAASGAASFAVYEFMNPMSRGLSFKKLVPSLFATGALGSVAGAETSSLVNKHQLVSLKEASDTCLSGGMMNLLLPGAQKVIGRGVDWAHVRVHEKLGWDLALDKTAGLNPKSQESDTLKQLIDDLGLFPVHRNKLNESGTSADHESRVINVDDPSDLALLGHEAKHIALTLSPETREVLKRVEQLVKDGDTEEAWKSYRALRLDHEFACRKVEQAINAELSGSNEVKAPIDKDAIAQSKADSGTTYEEHWRQEFDRAVEENDYSLLQDFAATSGIGSIRAAITKLKRTSDGKNSDMPRRKDLEFLLEKYESGSANVKQFIDNNAEKLSLMCASFDSKRADDQLNARFRERLELILDCVEKNPQEPLLKSVLHRQFGKYPAALLSDSYRDELVFPSLKQEIREQLNRQDSNDPRIGPYTEQQVQLFRDIHELLDRVQASKGSCDIRDLNRLHELFPSIAGDKEFQIRVIEQLSDRLSKAGIDSNGLVERLQQRLANADPVTQQQVFGECAKLADASRISSDQFPDKMRLIRDCLGPEGSSRSLLDLQVLFSNESTVNQLKVYSKLLNNYDKCVIELGKLNLPLPEILRVRNLLKGELLRISANKPLSGNGTFSEQFNAAYDAIKKLSALDANKDQPVFPNGKRQAAIILDLLEEASKNVARPIAIRRACRTDVDILALSYYRDLVLQSSEGSMKSTENFGGHLYQFNASRAIETLLSRNLVQKNAQLADWVFVPSGHGSAADSVKIDGAFINLKDGRLILIDLKSRPALAGEVNNNALEGLEWGCYIDHATLGLDRQSSRVITKPDWSKLSQELMAILYYRTKPSQVTYFENGRKKQTTVKLPVYNLADFPSSAGLSGAIPQLWLPSFKNIDSTSPISGLMTTDAELRELARFNSLPSDTELAKLRTFLCDRARDYNLWRSGRVP